MQSQVLSLVGFGGSSVLNKVLVAVLWMRRWSRPSRRGGGTYLSVASGKRNRSTSRPGQGGPNKPGGEALCDTFWCRCCGNHRVRCTAWRTGCRYAHLGNRMNAQAHNAVVMWLIWWIRRFGNLQIWSLFSIHSAVCMLYGDVLVLPCSIG